MKVSYTLSQSLIAADSPALVDVIVSFRGSDSKTLLSRRPLNLSLVLDRSGSMAGSPLKYAIQAAQQLVTYLTPDDWLSVVIYDDYVETIVPPQPVTDQATIQAEIGKITARGCTNLSGGWLMGCDHVAANFSADKLNRVLLLTDGLANVGQTQPQILSKTAQKKAEKGITTTTLGFGNYFVEDLLINMANAGKGNFYFIQSPDEAADVFGIEMESLVSVVAQNLTVTLKPTEGIQIKELLQNYPTQHQDSQQTLFLGDVYGVENKSLALSLTISPQKTTKKLTLLTLAYQYDILVNESIQKCCEEMTVAIAVGNEEEAKAVESDLKVLEQTSQLRIAQVKEEAVKLADNRDYQQAAEKLQQMIENLQQKALQDFFEIAEEISQLEFYAQQLQNGYFDTTVRKEMRDQSYQSRTRDRQDLKLRGISTGNLDSLEAISEAGDGFILKCERISGKLRVRVISDGYDPDLNVQFPRSIREEGATYVVDEITLVPNHSFYRASGNIRLLVKAGEERKAFNKAPKAKKLSTAKAVGTVADLETTDTVGEGILVQCVNDGKKIRARVVSDGYNPDFNVRFPRNVRQVGLLFVVEGIKETAQGGSYIALGKIKRLIQ